MVPRREQNGLNIQEPESDITASGKVTAEDLELFAMAFAVLKRAESDKNGVVPAREAMAIFRDDAKSHLDLKKSRRMVALLFLLLLLLLLSMTGLVALVTAMSKDAYVKGDTSTRPTMSNADDQVVGVRAATHNLPLLVSPVLPDDELFSVETIRFELPGTIVDPNNESGSGGADEEVGPSVLNSVRITRVEKVNRTAVVFHALGGEQIRVWNGVTTVQLSATGPEIPICSADVTCAAFQVEGAELAEKYLAEAEALLAPFEEGRRRLAWECRNPLGQSGGQRHLMQLRAGAICKPTNQHYCKRLAWKHGMTWLGKIQPNNRFKWPDGKFKNQFIYGCFADSHGNVRFVDGVDKEENMLWPFSTGSGWQRLELLDFECLQLSNQFRLDKQIEAVYEFIWWDSCTIGNPDHCCQSDNPISRSTTMEWFEPWFSRGRDEVLGEYKRPITCSR